MFIIGSGITYLPLWPYSSPIYLYRGTLREAASALATAKDTAKIAFAPNLSLFSVPSSSIMILSIPD